MVAPAALTWRAMRSRLSPSTAHGPATTWKWPPPTLTPMPQSTTVSMGWNFLLASLKGSDTRWTRSTMSMLSRTKGSRSEVSPTMPTTVSPVPWDTFAR